MGFDQQGLDTLFSRELWCVGNVSRVSPSAEQSQGLVRSHCLDSTVWIYADRKSGRVIGWNLWHLIGQKMIETI